MSTEIKRIARKARRFASRHKHLQKKAVFVSLDNGKQGVVLLP